MEQARHLPVGIQSFEVLRTVWIVQGNDNFAIFSSKAYAEEHRKLLIETWEKSIIKEAIPPRLNNRSDIEKHAKDYQDVVRVGKDHYNLIKGWSSTREGTKEYWYYTLMSNAEWDTYYQKFISHFVAEEHIILK